MATFSDSGNIAWYRSAVDPALLSQLMQRSNLRGALQTVGHLGWFATTGMTAYAVFSIIDGTNALWSVPLLLLALFVHGTMGPFMGLIAVHELQHRTVFRTRWLNALFEKIYAFISWSDYIWYQESHARHHRSTCHAAHDGEVLLPVKFTLRRWRVWLGLLAWDPWATGRRLQTVWRHATGRVSGDWYAHVLPSADPKLRRRHRNWARTLLLGHGLLALLFLTSGHGFAIVVFTFGTFYCSWLGFLCGVAQHYGMQSDAPDFRRNTRTFTCAWLPAFYYWNMQYHVEHHMYPAVPFFNLPKLHDAIKHDLPPTPHGLRATWREIMALKRRYAADPHFEYQPLLPDR